MSAAESIDLVVDPCRRRPGTEPIRHKIDRPQYDVPAAGQDAARAGERIETEPDVRTRRSEGYEGVERKRCWCSQWHAHPSLRAAPPFGVRRDDVGRPLFGRQRMEDRDDVRALAHEVVPQR